MSMPHCPALAELPYLHHTIPAQTAADGRVTTQPRVLSSSTAPTTTARYPCPVVSCPTRSCCCLCPVESTIINSTNPQTFIHSRDYRRALLLSGLFASQFFFSRFSSVGKTTFLLIRRVERVLYCFPLSQGFNSQQTFRENI